MRLLYTIILLGLFCGQASAQHPFGVAFYDVDRLYDTIPSRFYDDTDYTPAGRNGWDSERYAQKILSVARVVDSLSMSVVALYGVESEQVVRDIVEACSVDYSYIHRTQDYSDGLDFAILYLADRFFPDQVTSWRGALCVEGSVRGKPMTVVATYRSQSLGVLLEERDLLRDGNTLVVVGRPGGKSFEELGLDDHSSTAERAGRGNVISGGRWQMRDRVASRGGEVIRCDVYAKPWLVDSAGRPRPTFDRTKYYGGTSSALPIFVFFK